MPQLLASLRPFKNNEQLGFVCNNRYLIIRNSLFRSERVMDFSDMEKVVYGGNVEEDEELLAELLALQQEEEAKQRSALRHLLLFYAS